MHRCILSPFSEMLHAKAVGTAPSGNATVVCLERESHVFADDNQTILEIARTPQRHETDVIIELRSKDAMLPVTQDHRVPGCERADGVSHDRKSSRPRNFGKKTASSSIGAQRS